MSLPLLKDAGNLRGKRVLLRLDADLSIENGAPRDTFRLDRAGRTLEYLKAQGAKTLITGHIGRKPEETLKPVFEYLKKIIPVVFAPTLADAKTKIGKALEGEFVLLENLRAFPGETKDDPTFSKELASLADVYVNEAFAVSHRQHASIVGVPALLRSYAGFVFAEEVEHLSRAFSPVHPALLILGGAKFETKLPLIERFLTIADNIYVGGALANDVYRARGYEIGASLVSDFKIDSKLFSHPKLLAPSDCLVQTAAGTIEKGADSVGKKEKIVDAGTDALADLRALIEKAAFILWNGPLGLYEEGFDKGTVALAQELAECDAETIVGGGDSLAVISRLGLLPRFSFVSTGGGAMLEFLANQTLPGIEVLEKHLAVSV
jgi:phosphoglycerate kinase